MRTASDGVAAGKRCERATSALFPVALLILAALGGCTTFADLLTPGKRGGQNTPATISLQAVLPRLTDAPNEVVTLNVVSSYVRRDASRVRISSQSLALTSAELQSVPIGVDVATCLADAEHAGASGSCDIVLNLSLLVNGVVVDEQVVGPLRVTPGQAADVTEPVTLFEIASLAVVDESGRQLAADTTFAMTLGDARTLNAEIRDSRGLPVGNRLVSWSSSAPHIASVSSAGMVTAVSVGIAKITALHGTVSAVVSANVTRPSAELVIAGDVGSGRGTVRSSPEGINCRVEATETSGSCRFTFAGDAIVTLTSTPDDGNLFGAWGNACAVSGGASICTITMSSAQLATATFTALRRFSVVSSGAGDGSGRITGTSGIDCVMNAAETSGTCSVQVVDGAIITLTAVPGVGASGGASLQRFAGWSGACAEAGHDANGTTCTITVSGSDRQASAGFHGERRLIVDADGSGGGTVTADGLLQCTRAAMSTSGACEVPLAHGEVVSLQAIPDGQSDFAGWEGACSGSGSVCTVTLTQSRHVTATFTRRTVFYTLSLTANGPGAGSILVSGEQSCAVESGAGSELCRREVEEGTEVVLRALAGATSEFAGFTGDCSGMGECRLVMSSPRAVQASFTIAPVALTVESVTGANGSGSVRAIGFPGGIDCTYNTGGSTVGVCTMHVSPGSAVTLTASAKPASALVSWGGACAGSSALTCALTPGAAMLVTARFAAAIDVTMKVEGSGGGAISFSIPNVPAQNMCVSAPNQPNACRFSLPVGATGVFRGTPAPGYQFIGFTGPCVEGPGPVPVCTYRGFGFVREIQAYFQRP